MLKKITYIAFLFVLSQVHAQNITIEENNLKFQYEIKNQTLNIESDISKVFTSYQNSLNLIDLETQNLDVALENEEIALERYRLGNSTALELREAQTNAVEVESRLLNARYSTKISEIELLRLSGSLIQPTASE